MMRARRLYTASAAPLLTIALAGGLVAAPASAASAEKPRGEVAVGTASHQPKGRHVTVQLTSNGRLIAPKALRAGRHTFDVRGAGWAQLARPERGYVLAEFRRDLTLAARGNAAAAARLDRNVRFLGGATNITPPASSFTTTLHAGRYWLLNFNGGVPYAVPVKVTGRAPASVFPRVAGIITATDRRWSVPRTLPASGEVLVHNRSSEPRMVFVLPADAELGLRARRLVGGASLASSDGPGLGLGLENVSMSGLVAPGMSFVWKYNLPKGKYIVITDMNAQDGYQEVTLR